MNQDIRYVTREEALQLVYKHWDSLQQHAAKVCHDHYENRYKPSDMILNIYSHASPQFSVSCQVIVNGGDDRPGMHADFQPPPFILKDFGHLRVSAATPGVRWSASNSFHILEIALPPPSFHEMAAAMVRP